MDGKLTAAILVAGLLLCTSISSGDAAGSCPLSTIAVTQAGTGAWAHGQPVYAVTVRNTCGRAQSNVKVDCGGFSTNLSVDPSKLKQLGGGACLLNGGAALAPGQGLTFSYAWSKQFGFRPISSTVAL